MYKNAQRKIYRMLILVFVLSLIVSNVAVYGEQSGQKNKTNVVNLNSATVKEIMSLPGIGKKKAESIIAYRQETGGFQSIDELKKVDGIGKKTFDRIKSYIVIE